MANENAKRFVRNLFAACPNYRMPKQERDEAINLYVEKLSRWRLAERAWAAALSKIVADNDGSLPALSVIYGYLKQASAEITLEAETICQMFSIDDRRYVRGRDTGRTDSHTHKPIYEIVSIDPRHPPALPAGAIDEHVCIPASLQTHEGQLSPDDGRAWILQGWLESGAPASRCMAMFERPADQFVIIHLIIRLSI